MPDKNIQYATQIAKRDLLCCVTDSGIVAGAHHFVDLWARDSFFATFGLFDKKDLQITKKTIQTFLQFQRPDGLVPYRVMRSKTSISKYLGKPTYLRSPKANFRSHQSGAHVPDGGLLAIIASREYIVRSNDITFLTKNYSSLLKNIQWYEKKFDNKLISEWFLCEWADAVLKVGNTLYTNVLYWKALEDMVWLAGKIKKTKDVQQYQKLQATIGKRINEVLWNGSYFSDWNDWKRQDFFAAHPNMLAIIFGLATRQQTQSILAYAKTHSLVGWTLKTNIPDYPWWRTGPFQAIVGVPDYHNGIRWLQPGIVYAMALRKAGKTQEAKHILTAIGKKVIEHDGAHEVYEQNGRPVNRLFYRSEQPFAWSAGLFLWAQKEIFGTLK